MAVGDRGVNAGGLVAVLGGRRDDSKLKNMETESLFVFYFGNRLG